MNKQYYASIICVVFFSLFSTLLSAQTKNEKAIREVLANQQNAWNNGNIDEFMNGYWKNDSLMFIGSKGITYGFANTMNNYKRSYKDTIVMGKLNFEILHIKKLSKKHYWVVGKWHLKRSIGDVGGHFDLLFRKIKGKWKIVADHTS